MSRWISIRNELSRFWDVRPLPFNMTMPNQDKWRPDGFKLTNWCENALHVPIEPCSKDRNKLFFISSMQDAWTKSKVWKKRRRKEDVVGRKHIWCQFTYIIHFHNPMYTVYIKIILHQIMLSTYMLQKQRDAFSMNQRIRLFCRSLLLPVEMAEPLGPKVGTTRRW